MEKMNRNVEEMYTQVAFILFFKCMFYVFLTKCNKMASCMLVMPSATLSWIWWTEVLKINQMYTYQNYFYIRNVKY